MKSQAVKEMEESGAKLRTLVSNGLKVPSTIRRMRFAGGMMDVYYPEEREENPFITFARVFGGADSDRMGAHPHKGIEWIFCEKGCIRIDMEGVEHLVGAGQFFEIPAGIEHDAIASEDFEGAVVIFPGEKAY